MNRARIGAARALPRAELIGRFAGKPIPANWLEENDAVSLSFRVEAQDVVFEQLGLEGGFKTRAGCWTPAI